MPLKPRNLPEAALQKLLDPSPVLQWLEVLRAPSCGFRYDHFSVLCELLPVGVPSLAVCLQTLLHGTAPAPPRKP